MPGKGKRRPAGRRSGRGDNPAPPKHQPPVAPEQVEAVLREALSANGVWFEDVAVIRNGGRTVVRVTVDLEPHEIGSMSLDAVSEASRICAAALDAADVLPMAYTLEVSTPGVSRPLTEPYHFARARTRLVTVTLQDSSTHQGRLVDVTGGDAGTLVFADGRVIALGQVVNGRVEVELSRIEELEAADAAADEEQE